MFFRTSRFLAWKENPCQSYPTMVNGLNPCSVCGFRAWAVSLGTDWIYSVYICLLYFLVILIFHAKNMIFRSKNSFQMRLQSMIRCTCTYHIQMIKWISIDIKPYSFKEITIKYMLLYSEPHCYTTVTVINMWVFLASLL